MKDEINLLPPTFAQQRRHRLYLGRVGLLFHRLQIVLLCLVVLMGGLYGIFARLEQSLRDEVVQEQPANATVETQVQAANDIVTIVQTHATQHPPVTPRVTDVVNAMPSSIQLTALAWNADKNALAITGVFTSREAVTAYKTALERLAWVEAVQAPLSNFATGTKPTFTFTLTVKKTL